MTIQNNARYSAVARGITQTFNNEAMKAAPLFPTYCTITRSSSADEGYAMVGGSPGMNEFLGDRQYGQLRSAELTIPNQAWEQSLLIRRYDVDDDRLGMLAGAIGDLAEEGTCHPDELVFQNMRSGSSTLCWDGQFFYDTDHVFGDSGTQSNKVTVTVASTSNILPHDINEGVHTAMNRMATFKNDQGKFLFRPRANPLGSMAISCPLSMQIAANRAFSTEVRTTDGSIQQVIAPSGQNLTTPRIDVVPYLSASEGGSDVKMYVHYLGGRIKPFIFQMRQGIRTQVKGLTDDIEHKDAKFLTEARYGFGYLAWFYSVEVTFST